MKVIKKVDTTLWRYRQNCVKCESELEAEPGDVVYRYVSGNSHDPSYDTWTITCPVCSHPINIPPSKIPKAVQVEIQKGKLLSPTIQYVDQWADESNKTQQRKE